MFHRKISKNHAQQTIKKNKVKTNCEKTRHLENSIKTQVETVSFRLYFIVIFRQNEIQYFTTHIYTTQRESICHVGGKKDYPSEAKHDKEISND